MFPTMFPEARSMTLRRNMVGNIKVRTKEKKRKRYETNGTHIYHTNGTYRIKQRRKRAEREEREEAKQREVRPIFPTIS